MRFEDLSPEDQALLNTDFGAFEKEAAAQVELAQDMYETGFSKLAAEAADAIDAQAELEKQASSEEDTLDEESEKVAQELGAFIERGFFDGLVKEGAERHGNEWHYLIPFMEEKVAQEGAALAVAKFRKEAGIKDMAQRAGQAVMGAGRRVKGHAASAAKDIKGGAKEITRGVRGKDYAGGQLREGMRGEVIRHGSKQLGKGALKASPYAVGAGALGAGGYMAAKGGQKKEAASFMEGAKALGRQVKRKAGAYNKHISRDTKRGYEGLKAGITGKGTGINPGQKLTAAERKAAAKAGAKNVGKAALRTSPYALLTGGGAYGATKAVKGKKGE